MLTGCAPIFMLGLLGVSLGSWFFGTHIAARLTGLIILTAFMLYFALLNWTAQSNVRRRIETGEPTAGNNPPPEDASPQSQAAGGAHAEDGERVPFTDEDRVEWAAYLQTEGRILWGGVIFLTLTIIFVFVKN